MSRVEKAFLHLHHFVCQDPYRSNIGVICIERIDSDKLRAVATNGHILATAEWITDWPEDWPAGQQFHISLDTAKGLLAAYKKYEWVTIEGSAFADQQSFPDYQKAFPTEKPEPITSISFDAHYFDLMRKFLDKVDRPSRNQFPKQGIGVQFFGKLSPIIVEPNVVPPQFSKVQFVLMPVRA